MMTAPEEREVTPMDMEETRTLLMEEALPTVEALLMDNPAPTATEEALTVEDMDNKAAMEDPEEDMVEVAMAAEEAVPEEIA